MSDGGLRVIDIADQLNPRFVHHYITGASTMEICVYGNYIYAGEFNLGIRVFDIHDPAHPVPMTLLQTGSARAVFS